LACISLSIGYAATAEGVPVELLIPIADNRLYEDKRRGR
jgi:PleD family two-component response regulator